MKLLYKNERDAQGYSEHPGIMLMGHTMKMWERVTEHSLRTYTKYFGKLIC